VGIGGRNWKHYENLGYDLKRGEKILVPIAHLTLGSNAVLDIICDYCGKSLKRPYKDIMIQRYIIRKESCVNCSPIKTKESNMITYGVSNVMLVPEHRKSHSKTLISKYGTTFISSLPEIKEKISKTWKKKTKKEILEIQERTRNTNLKKYGVGCPLETESSRRNLLKTINRGSSQQKAVYDILCKVYPEHSVLYNKAFSNLSLDILITFNDKTMINVEYDSWYWHTPYRDRKRDEFLKRMGYKILRIKSGKLIPDKDVLIDAIEKLKSSDKKYFAIKLDDWKDEGYKDTNKRGGMRNEFIRITR